MTIEIRPPAGPDEIKAYYRLRWSILRAPWGEPEGSEADDIEDQCYHLAAIEGHRVIAVGRLQFNTPHQGQLRYMAVSPEYQGQGIGRLLADAFETEAANRGCTDIILDAREPAVPFYQRLGYHIIDKSYLLFNEIQHYRMQKSLDQ
jgi:ribosomal protein S18 acetylase RimI-like enzyme